MEGQSSLYSSILDCSLSYSNSMMDTNLLNFKVPRNPFRRRIVSTKVPYPTNIVNIDFGMQQEFRKGTPRKLSKKISSSKQNNNITKDRCLTKVPPILKIDKENIQSNASTARNSITNTSSSSTKRPSRSIIDCNRLKTNSMHIRI